MSRLVATLRLDAKLQARNKVYVIIVVFAVAVAFAMRTLLTPDQLRFFMPMVTLMGVNLTTVFLVGVLMMLERGEGTLDVVLVSPLRPSEYLASKLITLTALALVESAIIVGAGFASSFAFGWLLLAVILRASLGVALGVIVAVRFRSFTRFLIPAIGASMVLDLPSLWYLGIWPSSLFYVWPAMPSLLIAKAAFIPIDAWQLAYSLGYGTFVVGVALYWASRSMERFVVRGELAS